MSSRRPHLHRLRRLLGIRAAVQADDDLDGCAPAHWLVRDQWRITPNEEIDPLLEQADRGRWVHHAV